MPLGKAGNGSSSLHAASGQGKAEWAEGMQTQGVNAFFYDIPQIRKTAAPFLAMLRGILVFRVCYILGGVAALIYTCRRGGAFGWLFVWVGIAAVVDYLVSGLVKEQAGIAIRKQMRIDEAERRKAKDKRDMAVQAKQQEEAREWADRCERAQRLITTPSTFPCKRGEGVLHMEQDVSLEETRKVRQADGITEDQWTTLDMGTLFVTNQRIVFVGDNGSRNISIKNILDTKLDLRSLKLMLSNRAKPLGFTCGNPCLIATMITAVQDYPDLPLASEESLPPSTCG